MKYKYLMLLLLASTQLTFCCEPQEPHASGSEQSVPATEAANFPAQPPANLKKGFRLVTQIKEWAHAFYEKVWGTSPDISLTKAENDVRQDTYAKEAHYTRDVRQDTYAKEAHYTRNVILHALRIGQVRENTTRQSNTLGILAGILGTGVAHRIFKGFHGDLSALAIAASGLATWAGARSLGKWFINRKKRVILEARTQGILENTPEGLLYQCFLTPKQPINFYTLSDIVITQKIMDHVDAPTLSRMYSYWIDHQAAYPLQASRIIRPAI